MVTDFVSPPALSRLSRSCHSGRFQLKIAPLAPLSPLISQTPLPDFFMSRRNSRGDPESASIVSVVRCRPLLSPGETYSHLELSDTAVTVLPSRGGFHPLESRSFEFNRVYYADSTQQLVFQSVRPLVDRVLDSFNATVLAYGSTTTGKTYTMEGGRLSDGRLDRGQFGMIPLSVDYIFRTLTSSSGVDVRLSVIEIYKEKIVDLLRRDRPVPPVQRRQSQFPASRLQDLPISERHNHPNRQRQRGPSERTLQIMEDKTGNMCVPGARFVRLSSLDDLLPLLDCVSRKRQSGKTNHNDRSSRSHMIAMISVSHVVTLRNGNEVTKIGKLNLVDLAGSENVARAGTMFAEKKREAGQINRSYLTIGRVIDALLKGESRIPFRDSKLMTLLKDSFGGRNHTLMIATIAAGKPREDTIQTLRRASKAQKIQNVPTKNRVSMQTEWDRERRKLETQLAAQRREDGVVKVPPQEHVRLLRMQQEFGQLEETNETLQQELVRLREQDSAAGQQLGELLQESTTLLSSWISRLDRGEVQRQIEEIRSRQDALTNAIASTLPAPASALRLNYLSTLVDSDVATPSQSLRTLLGQCADSFSTLSDRMSNRVDEYGQDRSRITQGIRTEVDGLMVDEKTSLVDPQTSYEQDMEFLRTAGERRKKRESDRKRQLLEESRTEDQLLEKKMEQTLEERFRAFREEQDRRDTEFREQQRQREDRFREQQGRLQTEFFANIRSDGLSIVKEGADKRRCCVESCFGSAEPSLPAASVEELLEKQKEAAETRNAGILELRAGMTHVKDRLRESDERFDGFRRDFVAADLEGDGGLRPLSRELVSMNPELDKQKAFYETKFPGWKTSVEDDEEEQEKPDRSLLSRTLANDLDDMRTRVQSFSEETKTTIEQHLRLNDRSKKIVEKLHHPEDESLRSRKRKRTDSETEAPSKKRRKISSTPTKEVTEPQ